MIKQEYTIVIPSEGTSESALINPDHIIQAAYMVCGQHNGAEVEIWRKGKRLLVCNMELQQKFNVKLDEL